MELITVPPISKAQHFEYLQFVAKAQCLIGIPLFDNYSQTELVSLFSFYREQEIYAKIVQAAIISYEQGKLGGLRKAIRLVRGDIPALPGQTEDILILTDVVKEVAANSRDPYQALWRQAKTYQDIIEPYCEQHQVSVTNFIDQNNLDWNFLQRIAVEGTVAGKSLLNVYEEVSQKKTENPRYTIHDFRRDYGYLLSRHQVNPEELWVDSNFDELELLPDNSLIIRTGGIEKKLGAYLFALLPWLVENERLVLENVNIIIKYRTKVI